MSSLGARPVCFAPRSVPLSSLVHSRLPCIPLTYKLCMFFFFSLAKPLMQNLAYAISIPHVALWLIDFFLSVSVVSVIRTSQAQLGCYVNQRLEHSSVCALQGLVESEVFVYLHPQAGEFFSNYLHTTLWQVKSNNPPSA